MYGYIYMTTNLINGKKYIGKKTSPIFLKEKYLGSGRALQYSIEKYGKENFKTEMLEEIDSIYLTKSENAAYLANKEKDWILKLNAVNDKTFYNISHGGENESFNLPSEFIAECNRRNQSKKMKGRLYVHLGHDVEKFIWPEQLGEYLELRVFER